MFFFSFVMSTIGHNLHHKILASVLSKTTARLETEACRITPSHLT